MQQIIEIKIAGRIDKVLSNLLSISRNQVEKLIKDGLVSVNNKIITKTSHKLVIDDNVEYRFKEAEKKEPLDINFDIDIIYEDDDILIVNKPTGLIVHPAPSVKEPTLVDWLRYKGISLSTISGEERHGIVHRIDKETTGALVIAKNNEAHQNLSEQLQDKSMGRYYLALIDCPLKENVIVNKPIARSPNNRLKMDIVDNGKNAKTAFVKLAEGKSNIELIVAKLYTGRTHQIRVHLATLGRHILGDTTYGYKSKSYKVNRVQLHAYQLYLTHPRTKERMTFIAPLFNDMQKFLSSYLNVENIENNIKDGEIDRLFN
ncbi:Ribosomal large subunit pseudouridine synthase D [hydrothermal vent metagenome]|uniref:Ribosomal large subunit pseudouridine synthase D n=1 Tax=hydrothermal vent metagenome TaxID=652676 RepID=A0A1W1BIK0_9ZZZZ